MNVVEFDKRILFLTLLALVVGLAPAGRAQPPVDEGTTVALGLGDAARRLESAAAFLSDGATSPSANDILTARRDVEIAGEYFEFLVRRSAGRIKYSWTNIGKERVPAGKVDTDVYLCAPPHKGTMAVRFRAGRGDVFVIDMIVEDGSGNIQSYNLERWVRADLPVHAVEFLRRPTAVGRVILRMRQDGPKAARMYADLGVPESPEYARELRWLCREAFRHLRDGEVISARSAIQAARERLAAFQAPGW